MRRVLRSVPCPEAVAELVRDSYGLTVTGCTLIRSFVNDVYEVETSGSRYVLKLYHAGGWSPEEIAWEVEFVTHVAGRGVDVARVAPLTDGTLAGVLEAPEGPRPYALSDFVPGSKPRWPITDAQAGDELYRRFGCLVARFHRAAADFTTSRYRREFGLELMLDEPLQQVLRALAGRPEEQAMARDLGAAARQRLSELAEDGLGWGIRHGDCTLDNLLLVGDNGELGLPAGAGGETGGRAERVTGGTAEAGPLRLVLHDFDLAAPGWPAADLTGCLMTPFADAFRKGYTEIRELRPADLAALPWFRVLGIIGNLQFHLVDKPAWRGTESLAEGWADELLVALREAAAGLLRPSR